jgi:flagellar biosynthesis/type III secretory pathway M-ring protein FliF/YscJ
VLDNFWANAAYSLAPTVLVGLIFWFIMRAIVRADRTERKVYSEIEAQERAKFDADRAAKQ